MKDIDIDIKEFQTIDYDIVKQVDRSEQVGILYRARPSSNNLGLELHRIKQEPMLSIPDWDDEGIKNRISKWQPELDNGGSLLVAWQDETAVGFGIIGPKHDNGSVELCALFVSSEARQLGVGKTLFDQLEKIAKGQGARSLLVYSNPTESSVDFYLKQQCQIIGLADKRVVSHLPWDVVFAKPLL